MRVLLPDLEQGFCFGVRRAIEMVRSEGKPVAVIGQLVHNPGVIKNLEKEEIITVDSIASVSESTVVATTAHGATKQTYASLVGKKIVDTTCPYVVRLRNTAHQLECEGWKVIILGDASHPEIMSVTSFLASPTVVADLGEARKTGIFDKIALVSQTTQTHENLEQVAQELKKHCSEFKLADTICTSTKERQETVKKLASKAGAVVVVGGKKSANTKRLFELACKKNRSSFWIESASEIDAKFADRLKTVTGDLPVGVISGASTPVEDFEAVVKRIESI
jgi:(E)-4-hydroxy-3-methyl-but-2-enyl pyrophosphate reductase